jgi:hypothetical protein
VTSTMLDMQEPEEPAERVLSASDRCDQGCGAQARVEIITDSGFTLMFCGHHYNRFEASLIGISRNIFDTRKS